MIPAMAKKKAIQPKAKKKAAPKKAAKAVVDVPMLRCPITGAMAPAGTHGH
jgi:hypothetical protein